MKDAPLIERAAETARLMTLMKAARAGKGSAAVVVGEPGIGKSRLLHWCQNEAADLGLTVLKARCSQLDEDFSFSTVLQLFEPVLRGKGRSHLLDGAARLAAPLFDGSFHSGSPDSGAGYRYGLYWLLCNLAMPTGETKTFRPILLVVDDLQWADAPSARWLTYLLHRLEGLPVVLLAAARPPESLDTESPVSRLLANTDVHVVSPRPLTSAGTTRIVRNQFPEAIDAVCGEFHRLTEGNPFLIQALLMDEEMASNPGGEEGLERLSQKVPSAVLRSVLARLASLPPEATRLSVAVAILSDDAPVSLAAQLADLPMEMAGPLADRLAAVGILRRGEPLSFLHALVRSALYDDVPRHARAALHLRAARLLAQAGEPAERAAAHLLHSRGRLPAEDIALLRAAGRESLAKGDPASAQRFLAHALDASDRSQRHDLLLDLAHAQAHSDAAAAVSSVRSALQSLEDDSLRRAEAYKLLGRMLAVNGQPGDAAEAYREGLRAIDSTRGQDRLRQELEVGFAAAATLHPVLRGEGLRMLDEAMTRLDGMPSPAAPLLAQLSLRLAVAGEPAAKVRDLAERALRAEHLIDSLRFGDVGFDLAVSALIFVDELDLAETILAAGIERARVGGSVLGIAAATHWRAWVHFFRGRLIDAAADAEQAIAAQDLGWKSYLGAAGMVLGLARWEHGDRHEAVRAIDRCSGVAMNAPDRASLRFLEARMARSKGDLTGAVEILRGIGRDLSGTFTVRNPGVLPWRSDLALCLAALGEATEASHWAAEELELARKVDARRPLGIALRAAGLIEGRERGLDLLRESAHVLERSPSRLEYCRSLIALGSALRRSGHRSLAKEPLEEGLELARQFGSAVLVDRGTSELRTMGLRPKPSSQTGVEALTPSEHRVCTLAARGMSNRAIAQALFVTVKTVEMHLGRAYRKLNVGGRHELKRLMEKGHKAET